METTHSSLQNRRNHLYLRDVGLVTKVKRECIKFSAHNVVKRALKRRNMTNAKEMTLNFRENRRNHRDLLAVGLLSTLKRSGISLAA
jgi:hypothetical protein